MYRAILLACLVLFSICLVHADPPPPPPGGHWEVMPELTDEFNVSGLDTSKWYNGCTYWTGRTPSQFVPQNVAVSNGFLQLRMTTAVTNMADVPDPVHSNWVESACVASKTMAAKPYCYYEASIKVGRICMAQSFWFQKPSATMDAEEIDVIENFGEAFVNPGTTNQMLMNTHYWPYHGAEDVSGKRAWEMPYPAASDFHVYGVWRYETNDVRFYHNDSNVVSVVPGGSMDDNHYMFLCNEVQLYNGLPTLESLRDPLRNTMYVDWVHSWRLVPDADLAVGISVSTNTAETRSPFSYTLTITNKGPFAAANVVAYNKLLGGYTLVSASASQGTVDTSGTSIYAYLGAMASNATATVSFSVIPNQGGQMINTARIYPAEWGGYASNNTACLTTTVVHAELAVSPVSLDLGSVRTGALVHTAYTVTNSGDCVLTGTATASPPFAVVSGSPYTIAPACVTTVVVSLSAPLAGAYSGTVVFVSNGGTLTNAVKGAVSDDCPTAVFSGSPTNGVAPHTVTFTDASLGVITNRHWDFGDGATLDSTLASVQHTYLLPGVWAVTLTVSGPAGASTLARASMITVGEPASATWTNTADSGNWSYAGNWAPASVPDFGGDALFGTGGGTTVVDGISRSLGALIFNRAGNFAILGSGGAGLSVYDGIAASNAYVYTLDVPMTLGSSSCWFVESGGTLQICESVGGYGPVAKTGSGIVVLTASNSFSGGATVKAGTLAVGNDSALGSGILTMSGGTLTAVTGNRTLANAVNLVGNTAVGVGDADILTLTGVITNSGALTKTGDGTLTLTATNTYSGGTTISAGTVRVDGGVVSNVSIGATVGAALVVANGGRVFNSVDCAISNGANNSKSVIIDGANSAWIGKAANRLYINGAADTLVQVANGGVVSNFFLLVGYGTGAHRNSLVITNGGQVFAGNILNIASSTSSGGGNGNSVYVGSTTNAVSLLNGRGFAIELGKGNNSVTGNRVQVDQGGVITNISSIKIGSVGSFRNSIIITNGGQMFTAGASTNGIAAGANSNSVIIAGANGPVNSRWYMGGSTLVIGGNACATGNCLAVSSGGALSNGSVTLGGVGSVFTVGGVADLSGLTMGGTGSLLAMDNGRLRVPGVTVGANVTLSGTGCINAPVSINGNLVRGNGGGILTVSNSLTLSSSAVLQGAFGATGDVVAVTGTLTLDGTINITDAGGFAPGTYVLFTYPAGSLVNNGLSAGTVPNSAYGYAVDTGVAGSVRLVVTRPTFNSWLTSYSGAGAWNDDPDGDGEKNLMEYALNRNPMTKDPGGFVLSRASNSLPTVVYTRRLPPRDVSYWIERCCNLVNGGWDTNGFVEIRAADDGNGLTETVTVHDGAPVTNAVPRFYRLKVSQP